MKPYIDKERHKQVAKNWIFKYMMPFGGKMPAYFTSRHFQNELSKRHGKAFIQTEGIEEG